MDRIKIFEKEINILHLDNMKEFAKIIISDAPEYFFHVSASSTGKCHPSYALGEGGLVRHTKAVIRFFNYFMNLEQYSSIFDDIDIDCGIIACLAHDMYKSGSQEEYNVLIKENKKVYTVFEHPELAANFIRSYGNRYSTYVECEFIASLIESHMGQWNKSDRSESTLKKPVTDMQKLVHLADYLASRKDINVFFEAIDYISDLPDINSYKCSFGKYKDELLIDIAKKDPDYLKELLNNVTLLEPTKTFIKQLLEK